ncbi:hypothetical protein [Streptomyces sp.]|uniref:hypothetical protein n=1 Tax=Streptomyces sp. TaxID=1931 RepID=UPI002F953D6A
MTPAEELTAAADRLNELVAKATPGRWKLWGMEVLADIDGTSNVDTALPVARTSHEAGLRTFNATYIAAMNPLVGKALAEWLRVEARRYAKHPPNVQDFFAGDIEGEERELDYCVRIARLINGSRS